jgi:trk system potassium uptake protein TrkA
MMARYRQVAIADDLVNLQAPTEAPMAKNRLYEDDVLVIGLGRFGAEAALELHRLGHKVVAIEKDPRLAESFSSQLDRVILGDSSEPAVIEACRASTFKRAVIGIDSSIEASVLTAGNLIDAGISSIWAKAISLEHARILERIGVHHIVRPESDAGRRVAHLLNGKLQDYIAFDDGYAIVKMAPPRETVGFTLAQSQIRGKYGVTVVGVKAPGEDFTPALPETKVTAQHILIVSGPSDLIEALVGRP